MIVTSLFYRFFAVLSLLIPLVFIVTACGVKGPPLPPENAILKETPYEEDITPFTSDSDENNSANDTANNTKNKSKKQNSSSH